MSEKENMRWLEHRGCRMAYSVAGEGKPLILMHGWGCNSSTVKSLENTAVRSGWKVYNVDFPGFGQSSEPPEVWGIEDYTALIEELARAEKLESPALVGHSFGGRVAILFSSRNKTDRVVLVDAAGVKPAFNLKKFLKIKMFKLQKSVAKMLMSKEKYEATLEKWRTKRGSADYASASPRMRQILSKVVNEDLKHVMPQIKAPTLLLWGTADTATPLRDAKIMNRLIKDSAIVEMEGAGHYSFLDAGPKFHAVFHSFLSNNANPDKQG